MLNVSLLTGVIVLDTLKTFRGVAHVEEGNLCGYAFEGDSCSQLLPISTLPICVEIKNLFHDTILD